MIGQSPRELKRLLNNHRLMCMFMDIEGVLDGMESKRDKLVLWAFLCWRFSDDMHGLLLSGEVSLL